MQAQAQQEQERSMGMRNLVAVLAVLGLTTVGTFLNFSVESSSWSDLTSRRLEVQQQQQQSNIAIVPKYNQETIESLFLDDRFDFQVSLLVFDGTDFQSYDMGLKHTTFRSVKSTPLIVHALKRQFPHRFQKGSPVFQMVYSVSDFLATQCVNTACPEAVLPPIVSFGSVYTDPTVLPTTKSFPNPYFISCLYDYELRGTAPCHWASVDASIAYDDLIPTIVWRGTDFRHFIHSYASHEVFSEPWLDATFTPTTVAVSTKMDIVNKLLGDRYDQLTPRWRAAALTLKAKVSSGSGRPWIDCMFTGLPQSGFHEVFANRGIPVAEPKSMNEMEMSKYKYQIDLGGGGGTTWQGTVSKLLMPGVLFHHETQTKDWFYDIMIPWVHYIPVKDNLSDLWTQYRWAEDHPAEARTIAEEGSKLAAYLLSAEYMDKVYNELFVEYLGTVVDAYDDGHAVWADCVKRYKEKNIHLYTMSECDERSCNTEWGEARFLRVTH